MLLTLQVKHLIPTHTHKKKQASYKTKACCRYHHITMKNKAVTLQFSNSLDFLPGDSPAHFTQDSEENNTT